MFAQKNMPHYIQRIAIHGTLCISLILTMHILIQYKLLELRLSNGLFLIICFAIIQGLFEIVLHRFHTGDSKSKLFKMMAIRTAKFLLYLIISLIFLIYNTEQQRAISLVIIVLFSIYTIFELLFIAKHSNNCKP
ncbi:MAG: hypothetical protein BWY22_00916 [Bacteroidetes bacterium ADurb.Bin217]|nr:MAG: hypothetical protein BWY22_00916 [Bacteroidetes bacterium ADurb.Bin217]